MTFKKAKEIADNPQRFLRADHRKAIKCLENAGWFASAGDLIRYINGDRAREQAYEAANAKHPLPLEMEMVSQGKTVIQQSEGGYLIMHPDGDIAGASTKAKAERIARNWYKAKLGDGGAKMGIGEIEWR